MPGAVTAYAMHIYYMRGVWHKAKRGDENRFHAVFATNNRAAIFQSNLKLPSAIN